MSSWGGVAFLAVAVLVFIGGLFWMAAREKMSHAPKRTVEHFQRSRGALRKVYRRQVAVREAQRASARASHPAAQRRRHRRSA